MVNNAGILRDVIFHKMTPEDWLSVIAVHLNGSFFVSPRRGRALPQAGERHVRAHLLHLRA